MLPPLRKNDEQLDATATGHFAYGPEGSSVKSPTAVPPFAAPAVDRRMNFFITGGV